MSGETILVAAGGTGGHLFPAEALAHALISRSSLDVLPCAAMSSASPIAVEVAPNTTICPKIPGIR